MPTAIANFLTQQRMPRPADVEQNRNRNALLRNTVERLPQANKAQDLAIQSAELSVNDAQRKNALGVFGRGLSMIAASPRAKDAARAWLASPEFQQAGRIAGIPIEQFTVTDADTDDSIRTSAGELFAALGQTTGGGHGHTTGGALGQGVQQQRVQSTQVLEDGTIAYMTNDGQIVRTNERARNPMQVSEVGGAPALVDRLTGQTRALSSPEQENQAAAERERQITGARASATAESDRQKEQITNQRTLEMWRIARQDLIAALSGTTAGPVAGRFPAVTAAQQTADGAVAAVAPVLKQLFRLAGEGIFTDRDQALLLEMVPKRSDHHEAQASKIQMIDAIIEAKLGSPQGAAPALDVPRVGEIVDGYRYKGGNPAMPESWERQ